MKIVKNIKSKYFQFANNFFYFDFFEESVKEY